jgi:hypothetical protein
MTMRMTKLLMLAGLAIAGVGGAAAADPCAPPAPVVVQPEAAYDYSPDYNPDYDYDYDAAPPVVVERPVVAPRDRWVRPWRRERFREREIRREERREERRDDRRERREYGRTARSYRHGSRW